MSWTGENRADRTVFTKFTNLFSSATSVSRRSCPRPAWETTIPPLMRCGEAGVFLFGLCILSLLLFFRSDHAVTRLRSNLRNILLLLLYQLSNKLVRGADRSYRLHACLFTRCTDLTGRYSGGFGRVMHAVRLLRLSFPGLSLRRRESYGTLSRLAVNMSSESRTLLPPSMPPLSFPI